MKRGSQHLGKITDQHSHPQFLPSLLRSLTLYGRGGTWCQKWESLKSWEGQGSHNKPTGCSASGAYGPGPDEEEEHLHKLLYWVISSKFLFHCHILAIKFFYTLSFKKCSVAFCLSLLVSKFLMHYFHSMQRHNFTLTRNSKLLLLLVV
jgi:hypothetical protein